MLRFFLFVDAAHLQDQLHVVFGFISEALFELFAQGQLFELFAWGRGLLVLVLSLVVFNSTGYILLKPFSEGLCPIRSSFQAP